MDYKVFGCKTNKYFAEKWLVHPHLSEKEGYFIASCVVTDRAKAKWVKHAKKILPSIQKSEKLYLSGCGNIRDGVVDPRFFEVYPELEHYREKIEILPEDPDEWSGTPFVKGGRGYFAPKTHIPYRSDLKEKASELRKSMTWPEKNIWYRLLSMDKLEGARFVRQKPLLDYIVDFYCDELKLVIEIDGESHIGKEEKDGLRDKNLWEYGLIVLRFTNDEVLKNIDWVHERLKEYIIQYRTKKSPVRPETGGQTLYKGALRDKIRSLKKLAGKELFTRKYMVIQTGCDNFCTFCLTVQARGRHKWRPAEEIIAEIDEFVVSGGKEVVFTGINLGAWWSSTSNNYRESRFVELVERVLRETQLERLRISSLGVEFVTDELIALFENPRINAYVHLSIQSGSSKILKAMNRHYDGEQVRSVLEKLRNLKREDGLMLDIWADLIVGFPGETSEDYLDTEDIVRDFQITQLHAFPFSPHVEHYSVPAGVFTDQVPNHISQKRVKKLLAVWSEVFERFAGENVGQELRVLVEKIASPLPLLGGVGGGTPPNLPYKGRDEQNPQSSFHLESSFAKELSKFSGWSENYLFCDETNFEPFPWQEIARGKVIRGIYRKVIKKSSSED
jgi:MiaB/RimO family radical SAM methylthiotransferase